MSNIQLINKDCIEAMKAIPDASIDMVLTDPPYGTTACKWDSVISFDEMWEQLKRIIKPTGAIVLTASQLFTTTLIASNMEMFKYCWVWEKSKASGFAHAKNMPLKNVEDIICFSFGKIAHTTQSKNRMNYYPQDLIYSPSTQKNSTRNNRGESSTFGDRPSYKPEYLRKWVNYPQQTLKFASHGKTVHPTQKPVALMEYLIKTYTLEGERVLDFTMGSGTTGVACVNLNREFTGIELDKKYFKIAKERIQKAQSPLQDLF